MDLLWEMQLLMLRKSPSVNKEFLKFSQNIGNDLDLVQGVDGNASFKDGEIFFG